MRAYQSDSKPSDNSPVTILFLAANPTDTARLGLDEERRAIYYALRQARSGEKFQLEPYDAVHVQDLVGYLLEHKPAIVHFSAHGSNTGEIVLKDAAGNSQPVSGEALSTLFKALGDNNTQCVVLNACYSEQQAKELAKYVACVVGMSQAIGDKAASSFSVAFYQALGYGCTVKKAFDLGCAEIKLENLADEDVPKLICTKSDPTKIVFVDKPAPPIEPYRWIYRLSVGFVIIASIVVALWKLDGNLLRPFFQATEPANPTTPSEESDVWEGGATKTNPIDGAIYVYIPQGTYTIGASPENKRNIYKACKASGLENECNAEAVEESDEYNSKSFWIKRTEVSNAEYKRCVDAGVCTAPANDQWMQNPGHPVTHVTWDQADKYAKWIKGRLPENKEWEIACRGRAAGIYPWGNEFPNHLMANFKTSYYGKTLAVDSLPDGASDFGVLNLVGNVQEWMNTPHESISFRYVRGGSFDHNAAQWHCISAGWLSQGLDASDEQANKRDRETTGFRVVIINWDF